MGKKINAALDTADLARSIRCNYTMTAGAALWCVQAIEHAAMPDARERLAASAPISDEEISALIDTVRACRESTNAVGDDQTACTLPEVAWIDWSVCQGNDDALHCAASAVLWRMAERVVDAE